MVRRRTRAYLPARFTKSAADPEGRQEAPLFQRRRESARCRWPRRLGRSGDTYDNAMCESFFATLVTATGYRLLTDGRRP